MKTLSIITPVYNEEEFILQTLEKVLRTELTGSISKEIIIVNDGSTDRTEAIIQPYLQTNSSSIIYLKHEKNQGKGASIQTALNKANGDYIIIQDADMEYDPKDYNTLLKPLLDGVADVVYGSRFVGDKPHRVLFFWHYVGNRFISVLSNAFSNLNLTDIETGYKMFSADVLKKLKLKEKRFGFEPEVTAKIAKVKGIRIYEVGISYYGRTYKEGKKIKWTDGIKAIYCILRYNIFR